MVWDVHDEHRRSTPLRGRNDGRSLERRTDECAHVGDVEAIRITTAPAEDDFVEGRSPILELTNVTAPTFFAEIGCRAGVAATMEIALVQVDAASGSDVVIETRPFECPNMPISFNLELVQQGQTQVVVVIRNRRSDGFSADAAIIGAVVLDESAF